MTLPRMYVCSKSGHVTLFFIISSLFLILRAYLQPKELEKLEEAKLKAKFPNAMLGRGPGGHSAFLQKRLAKGVSFNKYNYFALGCTE